MVNFVLRGRAACIVVASAGVLAAPLTVSAQENQQEEGTLDTIIVTGTRDAKRTQFDTLTPIDVISSDAVNSSVSNELGDSLAQLVPSFNVQQQPSANGQQFVRPARLRGLSPDQTLVLINGKRFHRSSLISVRGAQAPDLAQIPSLAIKHIEVLRDGASAQYGSDAIAGVINIILDDSQSLEGFSQYSKFYAGDGADRQLGVRGGLAIGDGGSVVATAEWADTDETSRTRQRPDAIAFQNAHPDLDVSNPVQHWGLPETRWYRFGLNSTLPLTDDIEAYVFGTYADLHGINDFNWRNPDTTGSAFNPSRVFPGFNLRNVYPTGFTPRFGQDSRDHQATVGARGPINDSLRWDVSASSGSNRIEYFLDNSINASLGPSSPTSFKPGTLTQKELNLNADFVYEWQEVNVAFGAERREEKYGMQAGDLASYQVGPGAVTGLAPGSNGFTGITPEQAGEWEQTSYAAYGDVEVPVTDAWTVGAAVRYEDFSEFGDKVTGKFATRYAVSPWLGLRASYSTGFRAPTPGQLESTSTSQGLDTVTLQLFTTGRLSPNSPVAQAFGAQPLKPEASDTTSVGFTWQTGFGFSGSLDIYSIDVSKRFSQSRTFAVTPAIRQQLIAAGVPGAESFTGVSFFTNDFDTRTRGVDLVAAYAKRVGPGRLDLTAAFNYNDTEVTSGSLTADPTQRTVFEEGIPSQNLTAAVGYEIGPVKLTTRARYYGPWTDSTGNTTGDLTQRFGAFTQLDLMADWAITDSVSLALGAENVLDEYPDEAVFQASRGLIYSRNSPYGTDGGRYYVRMNVKY